MSQTNWNKSCLRRSHLIALWTQAWLLLSCLLAESLPCYLMITRHFFLCWPLWRTCCNSFDTQKVYIIALFRHCGLYFHWIFGWGMLCCYAVILKSLLTQAKSTKDANKSAHSQNPSRRCSLKRLWKTKEGNGERIHFIYLKYKITELV